MSRYRNRHHRFEIELPNEWHGPGFISRLLKFAIGHISPEPSVKEQQRNLERIAMKYEHDVINISSIELYGKEHATIVYGIPSTSLGSPMPVVIPHGRKYVNDGIKVLVPSPYHVPRMVLKNYSLIFDGIEYFVIASIDRFPEENFDEIIKTFRLL